MKEILFLSGPPRSGKDVIAQHLVDNHNFKHFKFAAPIRQVMDIMFPQMVIDEDESYDEFKASEVKPGITGRQMMIDFSEEFIKPRLGKAAFGELLAQNLIMSGWDDRDIVISDCGFAEEIVPLLYNYVTWLDGRGVDCYPELWWVKRSGCDFSNDSRSYPRVSGVTMREVNNDGTLVDLTNQVDKVLGYV